MQLRIRELEQRLMQNGVDIKPSNGFHVNNVATYDYHNPPAPQSNGWNLPGASYPSNPNTNPLLAPQHQETNIFRALPAFRAGCTGDNYLGVSGNSHLSSIKGTALSILGMEIDIADFDCEDVDEPIGPIFPPPQLYNKSYRAFLQTALNVNPKIEKMNLPSREEGFTYAQWYFRVLNPFLPLLHKPSFFKLVSLRNAIIVIPY